MAHLFLSHSHAESKLASQLAAALRARGQQVWFDQRLLPGQRWLQRVARAARNCRAMLILMTPAAEASPFVEMELAIAFRHRRPLIPLSVNGHQMDVLAHLQHIAYAGGLPPALLASLPPQRPSSAPKRGGGIRHSLLRDEENAILEGVSDGLSYREIGAALGLSARSVGRRARAMRSRFRAQA